ncbi:aminotransferase class I/II-fold pyridoxal phosphate-dependent enzyme [Pelagibius litoralis]|uniref:Aminotransferase n=1 Tax=Pelagibius litoralis TaxID=374515 RepID=A0A967C254_9PROT|nr:aminotransferase class I/II-fold pyridoxal phosphate-dependent enzyme [Pelagibius litoralis]NIA68776.1 aminotransferase class I/II-fold pyridoxal phosphate-dependent enzyme [Pelagibius litoralis]
MALKVAARGNVPPFIVMDVMRAANEREAAGGDVLHLEVGQPGTPAPDAVLAAARRALDNHLIGYTDAMGLPGLRRRIARHYADWYDVDLDPRRVMVTTGSSAGFLLSFLAAFEPGDRVALAAPGYPAYRNILSALGVEPILLPAEAEHRFQPTPELLERLTAPPDGLIVASPSNPAGTMVGEAELTALADYCGAAGIRLISDEIYHGICFAQPGVTALSLRDDAVVINSFSKYFSMTGWRLGWMILPEDLVRPVECLAQNLFISAPCLSQIAGEAAFDCGAQLDGYVAAYARNRSLLLEALPKAGLDRLAPADGAFYIYADVAALTNDSEAFCRRMLAEIGVAATPGTDFDPERGHHFLRLSFAGREAEMAEAARRLQDWLPGSG